MAGNDDTTAKLKAAAQALGFDHCGIAEAGPADPEGRLAAWLGHGGHAGMDWLARTQALREDPRLKLPRAKSVIVVARNYYAPRPPQPAGAGKVSCYAWGRDYHKLLTRDLRRLTRSMEGYGEEVVSYACVDSGPVLERAWAAKAGVGWVGKNGLIINQALGSWIFLGVVLTSLPLEADAPVPARCGSCTACIDACPTGALVAPKVVDSRRCIAYHSIENKEEIPASVAACMGGWVFGCDICQTVCPWNAKAIATTEKDFHPRDGVAHPDLAALAAMDDDAFLARFAGTPVMRAKRAGMARNAAIALANTASSGDGASPLPPGR